MAQYEGRKIKSVIKSSGTPAGCPNCDGTQVSPVDVTALSALCSGNNVNQLVMTAYEVEVADFDDTGPAKVNVAPTTTTANGNTDDLTPHVDRLITQVTKSSVHCMNCDGGTSSPASLVELMDICHSLTFTANGNNVINVNAICTTAEDGANTCELNTFKVTVTPDGVINYNGAEIVKIETTGSKIWHADAGYDNGGGGGPDGSDASAFCGAQACDDATFTLFTDDVTVVDFVYTPGDNDFADATVDGVAALVVGYDALDATTGRFTTDYGTDADHRKRVVTVVTKTDSTPPGCPNCDGTTSSPTSVNDLSALCSGFNANTNTLVNTLTLSGYSYTVGDFDDASTSLLLVANPSAAFQDDADGLGNRWKGRKITSVYKTPGTPPGCPNCDGANTDVGNIGDPDVGPTLTNLCAGSSDGTSFDLVEEKFDEPKL